MASPWRQAPWAVLLCPRSWPGLRTDSAFNRQFFSNGKLWAALATVVGLQALVVHWTPAQAIFDTTALSAQDWALAFAVASSILLLDEGRKLILKLLQRSHRSPT